MNVFIIAAVTADGFIAKNDYEPSFAWTSKSDKDFFVKKTKEAGVVFMGSNTYKTIKKPLAERKTIVLSRTQSFLYGLQTTTKETRALLSDLENEGFRSVAICGGAKVYSDFLKQGVVNELYLTVHPILFGTGKKLLDDTLDINLKLRSVEHFPDGVVLCAYSVIK